MAASLPLDAKSTRALIQPHIVGRMMLESALFAASLLVASNAQAATTEWLLSGGVPVKAFR